MSRLDRWRRHVLKHGIADAVRAFVDRYLYHSRRCVITYSPAAGPPAVDHVGGVIFRVATPGDLDRLQELERYGRGGVHRRYVNDEHDWLVIACDGDRIVATRRASRMIRDPVVSRVITLGPGQYWGADVFCLPEYRNRGIGRHLQVFGDRHMASLGYRERFGSVEASNTASLRTSRAAGRQRLYYVSYVRILCWERLRVSKEMPRHLGEGP